MVTKKPKRGGESKGLTTKAYEVSNTCELVWRNMRTALD